MKPQNRTEQNLLFNLGYLPEIREKSSFWEGRHRHSSCPLQPSWKKRLCATPRVGPARGAAAAAAAAPREASSPLSCRPRAATGHNRRLCCQQRKDDFQFIPFFSHCDGRQRWKITGVALHLDLPRTDLDKEPLLWPSDFKKRCFRSEAEQRSCLKAFPQ